MALSKARRRWAPLLLGLWVPACFLGGQTGDSADKGSSPPCNPSRSLPNDQISSLGYRASEVVKQLGGTRTTTLTSVDNDFWQALGVDPVPALPVALSLSVSYAQGAVSENQCLRYLSIEVVVSVVVGDGLLRRTGIATLEGTLQSAELTVELAPPATGDGSSQTVTLEARLTPAGPQGTLMAGGQNAPLPRPMATFTSP
jgi:hypothetical protein